jgi:hypothetical protein
MNKNSISFTRNTAVRAFRKENKKFGPVKFDNAIMRTARRLYKNGLLDRKNRGEYTLTKKARKLLTTM